MYLPEYAGRLIDRLEAAGFPAYAVGGCVRDSLLGDTPHDFDLCTEATPAQMKTLFAGERMFFAGEKHGTISVVAEGHVVEITTFRQETGYADNRHPDAVRFVRRVEEDLARRDYTINAMAYSPTRGLVDPFGGREDLKHGILRAVGDPAARFREDSLRILRGVRFAVRFRLSVEPETEEAMFVLTPLLDNLARERVFDELCKLLPCLQGEDVLHFAPVLTRIIPELGLQVGFDQHSPHHAFDLLTHTAYVVQAAPKDVTLRWAALLHDLGKPGTFTQDATGRGHFYGHAELSAQLAQQVLTRLKAPNALREQVVWVVAHHMTLLEPDRKLLRRRLRQYGWENTRLLLEQQQADFLSKGVTGAEDGGYFHRIRELLEEISQEDACLKLSDLAVSGRDLLELGYPAGPALGEALNRLLSLVVDEEIPNTKEALLKQAAEMNANR